MITLSLHGTSYERGLQQQPKSLHRFETPRCHG